MGLHFRLLVLFVPSSALAFMLGCLAYIFRAKKGHSLLWRRLCLAGPVISIAPLLWGIAKACSESLMADGVVHAAIQLLILIVMVALASQSGYWSLALRRKIKASFEQSRVETEAR